MESRALISRRLAGTLLRRPISLSFGTALAVQGANAVTGVLLARTLGPVGRGELTAVLLWPSLLAAIGILGLFEATIFYIARGEDSTGTLIGTSLVIGLLQSIVLMSVGVGIIPLILSHYGAAVEHLGLLFLWFIPLNFATLYSMAALNGLARFGMFNAVRLLVVGSSVVAIGGLALAHSLSTRNAVVAYLVANGLTALTALLIVKSVVPGPFRPSRQLAWRMTLYGLKAHSANVSGLANQNLDQLLISAFLAPVRLGLYAVAVTFTSLTTLVGGAVSAVALQGVAQLDSIADRTRVARRYIALTLAASAVVTVPLLVFAPELLTLLFGAGFAPVANVARILLVASVALSTNRVLTAVVNGVGRPLDAGIAETLALVVTAAGLAAMLPTLGLTGAALASLLAYAVSGVWMTKRLLGCLELSSVWSLLPRGNDLRSLLRSELEPVREVPN